MGERLCLLLYIASLLLVVSAQECSSLTSCRECITSPLNCGWCSTTGSAECFSSDSSNECDNANDIVNPRSDIEEENRLPLDNMNQVSLESVKLRLKVGESQDFTFSVKPAENFPLDVYMIMDLSNSLSDVLTTVQSVASQIADSLSNVSSDFHIGFGSFVDKLVPPYAGRAQTEVFYTHNGEPSSCEISACVKPITFEHNVDLTNVTNDFTSPIQSVDISTNADNPEGTLDAMLQAVVCGDVIGWRETSRKILLVITDATIHTAGDGRLAGILEPNDGQCHTEYDPIENKVLYDGTIQDYPSIHQLREIFRNFNAIPIFAIAQTNVNISPRVTKFFRNEIAPLFGGFTEELTSDADNIIDVLQEAYDAVVSRAGLTFAAPDYLSISVDAQCPGGPAFLFDRECTQINGSAVNFTVSVTLDSCTDELANGQSQTVVLTIPGFGEVSMMIEGHCSCSCENTLNNDTCSGNGQEVCGVCECDEGWSGNLCECSEAACAIGPNQLECSGQSRGECVCGECVCNSVDGPVLGVDNPLITGDACECSNYECEQDSSGVVCSGRGTCTCSDSVYRCECDTSDITGQQHTGPACQCSTDHCINPASTGSGVCSGHGNCSVCEPPGRACSCVGSYFGDYCEISRANTECDTSEVEDCVLCIAGGSDSCGSSCSGFSQQFDNNNTIEDTTQVCSFSTAECSYRYSVVSTTDGELLYMVDPEDCLLIPIYAIALIILGGLIILAIVILGIIKLCLMYQDYREYKRFEYEVSQAQSVKQNNPVYTAPITHIENPIHGKPM